MTASYDLAHRPTGTRTLRGRAAPWPGNGWVTMGFSHLRDWNQAVNLLERWRTQYPRYEWKIILLEDPV